MHFIMSTDSTSPGTCPQCGRGFDIGDNVSQVDIDGTYVSFCPTGLFEYDRVRKSCPLAYLSSNVVYFITGKWGVYTGSTFLSDTSYVRFYTTFTDVKEVYDNFLQTEWWSDRDRERLHVMRGVPWAPYGYTYDFYPQGRRHSHPQPLERTLADSYVPF